VVIVDRPVAMGQPLEPPSQRVILICYPVACRLRSDGRVDATFHHVRVVVRAPVTERKHTARRVSVAGRQWQQKGSNVEQSPRAALSLGDISDATYRKRTKQYKLVASFESWHSSCWTLLT